MNKEVSFPHFFGYNPNHFLTLGKIVHKAIPATNPAITPPTAYFTLMSWVLVSNFLYWISKSCISFSNSVIDLLRLSKLALILGCSWASRLIISSLASKYFLISSKLLSIFSPVFFRLSAGLPWFFILNLNRSFV